MTHRLAAPVFWLVWTRIALHAVSFPVTLAIAWLLNAEDYGVVAVAALCTQSIGLVEHLALFRPARSDLELRRIKVTTEMIPRDVRTVLDVGSGGGSLVHRLPAEVMGFGVDYALGAARSLPHRGVCGSSERLPFRSRAVDLVLCCELLEHLPDDVLALTIGELERVSGDHILVSVPYREQLRRRLTKCQGCGEVFHIWGHLRSFSDGDLDRLFKTYRVRESRFFGPGDPREFTFVHWVNQSLGGRWADFAETTMCPVCGDIRYTRSPRTLVTMTCKTINVATSILLPRTRAFWAICLYSRE